MQIYARRQRSPPGTGTYPVPPIRGGRALCLNYVKERREKEETDRRREEKAFSRTREGKKIEVPQPLREDRGREKRGTIASTETKISQQTKGKNRYRRTVGITEEEKLGRKCVRPVRGKEKSRIVLTAKKGTPLSQGRRQH